MKINAANKVFILSLENTNKLIEQYIAPAYPECKFETRQSEYSNSIYIKVEYEDVYTIIRLSDHPPINPVKFNYISPRTKLHKVIGIFVRDIENIKKYKLYQLLNMDINKH